MEFGQFPEPRPFQDAAHAALQQGFRNGHKNQLIMAPTGAGKCLGLNTPVLLSDGSVKMVQDVIVGDQLMGPDGRSRNVMSLARGRELLYRVTPDKGSAYVVNESHILSLRNMRIGVVKNINVREYMEEPEHWRIRNPGWRIPGVLRGDLTPELSHITVDPIGDGDYYGFEIDGDHLFLLGDFTVTHNTYLGLRVAEKAVKRGRRAVFVCDRRTLINQTSATADRYGMSNHGVLMASHWRYRPDEPLQIASAQTIEARGFWPKADVIIVDEAHTQLKVWTEYINETEAAVVGLSATPFSPGLGRLFSNLINATTMHDLTESGVLVPMKVFTCRRPDMAGAKTAGGEWTDREAEKRGMQIIGDVVTEWHSKAENRKTIIFGATIDHCKELCRRFIDSGVMAAVFTAETTESERASLLDEYTKPDSAIRILISVEALAKGFDVQDVGCVVDCRPLRKSLSTAIQMWGRGLRSSPSTGKQDCILLDHSGNIVRFKEDFEDLYFNGLGSLDDNEKLDKDVRKDQPEIEERACPACGYSPFFKRCMACGHEHVKPNLVEAEPGEMHEIMIGKRKMADSARDLWGQVCAYARHHSTPEKQEGRAWHLFHKIAGYKPPSSFKLSDTPLVEVTPALYRQITHLNIRYAKGYTKA